MNQRVATICVALSGLNARGGLRPQGVALGWYVDGPLGRNHNMDRNRNADGIRKNADAFPLNRDNCDSAPNGAIHASLGQRPRNRFPK